MRIQINQTIIKLQQGDICQEDVDAIVNAANSTLLGGGGVDGAIHRAAGPELLAECRKLNGCKTGDAKITGGYKLKARHIIHTVGPIYGNVDAPVLLASAYRRSLEVARENQIKTISFPAISTGIYGYPMKEAAEIALQTIQKFVQEDSSIEQINMVLFDYRALDTFSAVFKSLFG